MPETMPEAMSETMLDNKDTNSPKFIESEPETQKSTQDEAEVEKTEAEKTPALRVPLRGKYLIEASAGTGKTWTLTGIVLRLLIEAKRPPEQIIATTFTRAAAAEMRQRINERLVDFYQLLQWFNKLPIDSTTRDILYPQLIGIDIKNNGNKQTTGDKENVDIDRDNNNNNNNEEDESSESKVSPEQRQTRIEWLKEQAQLAGNADLIKDPINSYLLEYLLDNVVDYSLAVAIRRCALVLNTLDKLFVGTLDSLSQKWLSEYSAETGHQQGIQISDHEQIVIESIIHDAVRAFRSQMYNQQPEVYALLQHGKLLTTPADHLSSAQKSLQFISTSIDNVEMGEEVDFVAYQHALDRLKTCDLKDIEPYFDINFGIEKGLRKGGKFGKTIFSITTIQKLIYQYGSAFFANLDADSEAFYGLVSDAFISKEEGGNVFNKGKEAERSAFINLESIQTLKTLRDYTEQIKLYLHALIENLNRDIALKVRQKLPSILEARRETTFALQMVRLNQALSGKQGARLARYIRHHYPVALIDESQDVNGEQAQMIERIYINQDNKDSKNNSAKEANRGFLLLVGDPKQAIYGFRGGDVANYNAMKTHFDAKNIMSLDVNQRSNERLIIALNHWFGRSKPAMLNTNTNTNTNIEVEVEVEVEGKSDSASANELAQLGKGIYYQHITAAKKGTRLSWQDPDAQPSDIAPEATAILSNSPVSIIHLPHDKDKEAKYDDCELTALHIAALLASKQTIDNRPLKPSDIGVLGRTKKQLKAVEDKLSNLGVPTIETAETNVFDTVIATDLIALLEAILRPNRRDIINRVLTSHLYQLSLNDVQDLMLSVDSDVINVMDAEKSESEYTKLKQRYQDFQTYLKTAASYWQHGGVLSALHYVLSYNPLLLPVDGNKAPSIWEGLADLEDGARYLMDLRHLLDILAQHGMHIGEYELLSWYKKNMNSSQTPEWARQQPLPTESGVQLMTIHKSKGLEFPVVYVLGMDAASVKANDKTGGRNKHKLYLYDHHISDQDNDSDCKNINAKHINKIEKRLSVSPGKLHSKSVKGDNLEDYYAQFETKENYEERKRLAYVAFTRASEQLYIVFSDAKDKRDAERKPSLKWLSAQDHKFVLPERLQDQIGWLGYQTVESSAEAVIKASQASAKHTESESTHNEITRIDYDLAYAQIKHKYFKGWAKTSFTALSRQLSKQSQALAIFDDGIEDDLDLTDSMALLTQGLTQRLAKRSSVIYSAGKTNNSNGNDSNGNYEDAADGNANSDTITADDIRFRFVKGANAGTFLHEIFEKIDFTNTSKWSAIIDQSIRQYQLPVSYTSADYQQRLNKTSLISENQALNKAVNATSDSMLIDNEPLVADHDELLAWVGDVVAAPLLASGQPLKAIPVNQRIAELGFNMGLSEVFTPERLNETFAQYLPDDPDKHIQLTAQYSDYMYRYLRGEIDLVYEHAGKYYVVDYKSNYLGNSLSNYNDENLSAAMSKAGYWLQAAIYQVALHRFLRLRLNNYQGNETQFLGAVEYVFLRGIDSQGADNYGRIQWQIPFALVQALDELFGTPSA